ncbi:MAG: glycine betaine/L-proline ABC transporter ATP-binding protein [Rhodospirillales bacterium]|nr:glycine betaine/L-proline ABC transporter ATP-binding protein [Rhodospirillales bacterium]
MSEAEISCRGVWKLYGPDPTGVLREHGGNPPPDAVKASGHISAVRDASFDVSSGEILVIMGLSGSGKSTLVRCLSRLIDPTAGEVFIDGQDLARASEREMIDLRRHKMGMVFQHFALLPHRTVIENVAFPLEVQGIDKAARRKRAMEIIELVGLKGRERYYPRELSGGQQQRVGIARSLAVEPDIWFLDEPFSALDPLIRHEMQDEFLRLQSMLNKTIVFITHDFDEAIRLADRVAIMFEGQIQQLATPEEIVTAPATNYVAEFTKNVPREKILRIHTIMDAATDGEAADQTVHENDRIADAAAMILEQDKPVRVIGANDAVVGSVSRKNVINALFAPGA